MVAKRTEAGSELVLKMSIAEGRTFLYTSFSIYRIFSNLIRTLFTVSEG